MAAEVCGLAILLWSATPERPELCATPLVHALAARALDCEVEVHVAGPAVRLMVAGVAEGLSPAGDRTIADFIREAAGEGVRFYACSMAMAAWVAPGETLRPECTGAAGATAFIARSLDPCWRTLTY